MGPTLQVGDSSTANMEYYKSGNPRRGDVIIFPCLKDSLWDFVEKVIGIGGEKMEIIRDKIYINDRLIDYPWGYYDEESKWPKYFQLKERYGLEVVPKDSIFLFGDNCDNSQDSRF